jgi:predicted GNAT family acetyltransferase
MTIEIRHDPEGERFVADLDGAQARLQYAQAGPRTVDFLSTYVPPSHRGRGIGDRLVLRALDWAREQGYRVIATCWFVGTMVERHPEYGDLLTERDRG